MTSSQLTISHWKHIGHGRFRIKAKHSCSSSIHCFPSQNPVSAEALSQSSANSILFFARCLLFRAFPFLRFCDGVGCEQRSRGTIVREQSKKTKWWCKIEVQRGRQRVKRRQYSRVGRSKEKSLKCVCCANVRGQVEMDRSCMVIHTVRWTDSETFDTYSSFKFL